MDKGFLKSLSAGGSVRAVLDSMGKWERAVIILLAGAITGSFFAVMLNVYGAVTEKVPNSVGTLKVGVRGSVNVINPLLATSDEESELSSLVYDGLLKFDDNGEIVTALAESYDVDEDGLEYVFNIRKDVVFHDGHRFDAGDVVFTVEAVKDPLIKSPYRVNFDGVDVEKIDDYTVKFTLDTPYAGFLYNMTIGILPEHLWSKVSYEMFPFSQLNKKPVGTGAYYVDEVNGGEGELVVSGYRLKVFKDYYGEKPYIRQLDFLFYDSVEMLSADLGEGVLDMVLGIDPEDIGSVGIDNVDVEVYSLPTPRIFILFMNQARNPALDNRAVRRAIYGLIDGEHIVNSVYGGYGQVANSVFPPSVMTDSDDGEEAMLGIEEAKTILANAGFKYDADAGYRIKKTENEILGLDFTLTVPSSDDLVAVAEYVSDVLSPVGINVELRIMDAGDLMQSVIPQRDYELLLFGETFLYDTAIYAYWHSSQRLDPGLNIASYTNIKTDRLLQNAITESDKEKRFAHYEDFLEIIDSEIPVKPLFSPGNTVIVRKGAVKNIHFPESPYAVAMSGISDWYLETRRILKFADKF